MHIRLGWSGETNSNTWQKADVSLAQEDLLRLLAENNLPPELAERLPTRVLFQLLQNECEFLLLNKLKSYGYPTEQAAAKQADLMQSTGEIIDAIKHQLSPA